MKHASIRELFAYWNLRRGARRAPDRGDIDPAVIRSVRLPPADAHTPQANAIMSASYSEPSTIQSGLVETSHADSSLTVWEIGLYPS